VDVWVEVEAHQLEPVLKSIVLNCIVNRYVGRERDQAVVDENVAKLRKVLEVYEVRLATSRYLGGDELSIADLSHFGFMRYFMATEYAGVVDAFPRFKASWDALVARPTVKNVMAGMPPNFGFGSGNIP
jgi:glutathione S-transferase